MGYWVGQDGYRVALVRKTDVDRLGTITGLPVSGTRLDAAIAAAIEELAELKAAERKRASRKRDKTPDYLTEDEIGELEAVDW